MKEQLRLFANRFESNYNTYRNYALRYCGSRTYLADDILQDVGESIVLYILRGGNIDNIDAFIYSTIKLRQRDATTRVVGREKNPEPILFVEQYTYQPLSEDYNPDKLQRADLLGAIVVRTQGHGVDLRKTQELRDIFRMEIDGYTRQEIADRYNTTPQKITDKINRYRRKIKT